MPQSIGFEVQLEPTGDEGWYFRSPSQYYEDHQMGGWSSEGCDMWLVYGTEFDHRTSEKALIEKTDRHGQIRYKSVTIISESGYKDAAPPNLGRLNWWDAAAELKKFQVARGRLFNTISVPCAMVQDKFDKTGASSYEKFRVKSVFFRCELN
jgi:hypothetical protein